MPSIDSDDLKEPLLDVERAEALYHYAVKTPASFDATERARQRYFKACIRLYDYVAKLVKRAEGNGK